MTLEPGPTFGELLRRLRQTAGLSQEELAERADLTAAAIGALERGERRHPYPHTLQALANALGLSPAERSAFFTAVPRRGATSAPPRWSRPPAPLTPLVGRKRDVQLITGLFQRGGARLVTLTGLGGVGKTRLAVEVAARLGPGYGNGPVWVDLAPVRAPELVLGTIARALGLTELPGQGMAETLESYLAARHVLLVLDNFEHLLAAAPSVPPLLECCPSLAVLATSREALRVRGEHEVQVPPLGLSAPEAHASAERVAGSEAAELFLQRVRAVRPGFELMPADAPLVDAICARLDGIPLALELAAAQLKYMSLPALASRLQHRLALLEGGARDLPARQQSLRATIGWSYELLAASEQELFRGLAVFGGGFTREAVQAVCGGESRPPDATARTLAALVDKSMVQVLPDAAAEARFGMLETVREYAGERLAESGEGPLLANRHAAYFCELVEAGAPPVGGMPRGVWLGLVEGELANLRAALAWTTTDGDPTLGHRLAGALAWFWIMRGYIREGAHWTDRVLARPVASAAAGARAGVLFAAAALAWKLEDYALARGYAEEAVAIRRGLGEPRCLAYALSITGLIATSQGDLGQASQLHAECLSLLRQQDDRWGVAYTLANLGDTLVQQERGAEAHRRYAESLEQFEQVGDPWGRAIVLHTLGNLAWAQGDVMTARARYAASVALFRTIGNPDNMGRGLIGLAAAALSEGDADEAHSLLAESLTIWRDFGSRAGVALSLAGLASVRAARGRFREAARLFGAADAHSRGRSPLYVVDADTFSRFLDQTRERTDSATFARAWAEGQAMSLDEAVEDALAGKAD
jgi:predicted ATPase/transcriptional regulator with XRE-family HTH domain